MIHIGRMLVMWKKWTEYYGKNLWNYMKLPYWRMYGTLTIFSFEIHHLDFCRRHYIVEYQWWTLILVIGEVLSLRSSPRGLNKTCSKLRSLHILVLSTGPRTYWCVLNSLLVKIFHRGFFFSTWERVDRLFRLSVEKCIMLTSLLAFPPVGSIGFLLSFFLFSSVSV